MNDKYKKLSKEELLRLVEKQENELKTKKYGLTWDGEREPEQVVLDCENNLPILERLEDKEIRTNDGGDNILIEGDNYHALTVLNYTHKERIDVIYIDPPFNTGAKTWKYNNNYIDPDDGYKHSKWLNMMEKRLNLAKKLLSEQGFLICAIDANEIFSLGLLLDKIFGERNRLGLVTVLHNPKGRNFTQWFSANSEYMLVYSKNVNVASFNSVAINETIKRTFDIVNNDGRRYRLEPFMRSRTETLRKNKPDFWYPIYVSKDLKHITLDPKKGYYEVYPIASNGKEATWINLPETFKEKNKKELFVPQKENGSIQMYRKYFERQIFKNVWTDRKYQSEFHGTSLLKEILGRNIFDYPKSLYLIEDILKITAKRDSVILDFFAGSGTTGHAVLKLNKDDGGNRTFILCTNNEDNNGNGYKIAEDICYPRIKKVIEGYTDLKGKKIEDLGGNLQYFKTAFVKRTKNSDQLKLNLTQKCTQMLCVKENIFNLEKEGKDYKIFSSNKQDRFLCIYYNFVDDSFEEFLAGIKKLGARKIIYMFSVDNVIDEELFSGIKDFSIEAIPQQILDIYKQLIRLNIRRK